MRDDRTTVQVSVEAWQYLNGRKRPGESMDDVLRRELEIGGDRDDQTVESENEGRDYSVAEDRLDDAPGS